jgi:hypothetical protein
MDDEVRTGGTARRRRRQVGVAVALATVLSAGAGVAQAFTPTAVQCGVRTTTKAFAAWGDTNDYFPMPGGTFDSASDWFLSEMVTAKNLPKGPQVPTGTRIVARTRAMPATAIVRSAAPAVDVPGYTTGGALQVRTTDLTTSRTVCIRPNEPSVRFHYRDSGVAGSYLDVTVVQVVHSDRPDIGSRGVLQTNTVRIPAVPGPPTWRVSPIVQTGAVFGAATADLFVTLRGFGGDFQVDNLYVDPFRTR